MLDALHSPENVDSAPHAVYASLLDRGSYLCSIRTMYRILSRESEVRERRNQRRRPKYKRPELSAVRPNELWSWDITRLRGPAPGVYYQLYVIIDVFSRYVPGWLLARHERGGLASRLIEETCRKQGIEPDQLTIHADYGAAMKSKPVKKLLADLAVIRSHSRPYRSNDNPFSPSRSLSSKPSSIARSSLRASTRWRMPDNFAAFFLINTTNTITTRVLPCFTRKTSTTAEPGRSSRNETRFLKKPGFSGRNASRANLRESLKSPSPYGSIRPFKITTSKNPLNFLEFVSHFD